MAKKKTPAAGPLGTVRLAVTRLQGQAERTAERLRTDVHTLTHRARRTVLKEVRALERRLIKAVLGPTARQLSRLERRIRALEQAVTVLRRNAGPRSIA